MKHAKKEVYMYDSSRNFIPSVTHQHNCNVLKLSLFVHVHMLYGFGDEKNESWRIELSVNETHKKRHC